ncbi:hypothetical protein [Thermococcus sp. AM4]|uniref:hypothetical protein n=1 Tax=Thermococcus sp. (strain AM4) TaxID=246969 RepID=UPI0001871023|nr:hypothetical protein [Thermococcus sp. AM4]EEB74469.1 conserved hypothetical protein [Thermococcus sp. AM4]
MDVITALGVYSAIGIMIGSYDVIVGLFEPERKIEDYETAKEIQAQKDNLIKGILFTSLVTLPSFSFWVSFGPVLSEDYANSTWAQLLFFVFFLGAWARLIYKLYLWKRLGDMYKEILLQKAIAKGVELGMKKAKEG